MKSFFLVGYKEVVSFSPTAGSYFDSYFQVNLPKPVQRKSIYNMWMSKIIYINPNILFSLQGVIVLYGFMYCPKYSRLSGFVGVTNVRWEVLIYYRLMMRPSYWATNLQRLSDFAVMCNFFLDDLYFSSVLVIPSSWYLYTIVYVFYLGKVKLFYL